MRIDAVPSVALEFMITYWADARLRRGDVLFAAQAVPIHALFLDVRSDREAMAASSTSPISKNLPSDGLLQATL